MKIGNGHTSRVLALLAVAWLSACSQPPECRVASDSEPDAPANAGCLVRLDDRMLMVKQRFTGRYSLPGGHSKGRESAQCTAHRETWEESGLNVQVGSLLGVFGEEFRLYECWPADPGYIIGSTNKIPAVGMIEVTGAHWVVPSALKLKEWRYPEDAEWTLELFNRISR